MNSKVTTWNKTVEEKEEEAGRESTSWKKKSVAGSILRLRD
jgi:hypothetical protein